VIREKTLIVQLVGDGVSTDLLSQTASFLRLASSRYDQAARSASC
jgi:predicted MarR family transcription regulator